MAVVQVRNQHYSVLTVKSFNLIKFKNLYKATKKPQLSTGSSVTSAVRFCGLAGNRLFRPLLVGIEQALDSQALAIFLLAL